MINAAQAAAAAVNAGPGPAHIARAPAAGPATAPAAANPIAVPST
jgi:hypothetical protein